MKDGHPRRFKVDSSDLSIVSSVLVVIGTVLGSKFQSENTHMDNKTSLFEAE
jgi:hypothetical protein